MRGRMKKTKRNEEKEEEEEEEEKDDDDDDDDDATKEAEQPYIIPYNRKRLATDKSISDQNSRRSRFS
jgi:hypothetical protein